MRRRNPVDKAVGTRAKRRRKELGLTQIQIAAKLELTLSQVYKYENGIDRMSAGRLHELAQLLHVPIRYFFQDDQEISPSESHSSAMGELRDLAAFAQSSEGQELCAAFILIVQPRTRRLVVELIEALEDEPTTRPKRRK